MTQYIVNFIHFKTESLTIIIDEKKIFDANLEWRQLDNINPFDKLIDVIDLVENMQHSNS